MTRSSGFDMMELEALELMRRLQPEAGPDRRTQELRSRLASSMGQPDSFVRRWIEPRIEGIEQRPEMANGGILVTQHIKGRAMCGFVGLIGVENAASSIVIGLQAIQHRGQDAGGVGHLVRRPVFS